MTKQGRSLLVIGVLLAIVLLGASIVYRRLPAQSPAVPATPGGIQADGTADATGTRPGLDVARGKGPGKTPKTRGAPPLASAGTKAATDAQRLDVPRDPEVKVLEDLLDGDDSAATLAQAQKMTASPKVAVRSAALDALRWLGGRDAAHELAGMLNDADADIAAAAADGLLSVLGELDDPALTAAALEQAIPKAVDGDSAEALFLSLSGLPENLSVPVLLNLLESKVTRVSALAKEYLEFVTGGEEITNRSQGEAWLRENQKPQADTEKN